MHFYVINHNIPDSGHGGQTKDLDGDEEDGFDEGQKFHKIYNLMLLLTALSVIYPLDYKKQGHIVDDVNPLILIYLILSR